MAISSSNTKKQILEAYDEQLKELETIRKENSSAQRQLREAEKAVVKAKEESTPSGKNAFSEFKDWIDQELNQIENKLEAERDKFRTLHEAVEIEKKNLEEMHQITAKADSLEALTITHRKEKQKLDDEIDNEREEFKEAIDEQRKKWEREKEDYEFQKKVKRRNEEDAYHQEKAELEKELKEKKESFDREFSEREDKIVAREQEYEALKKEVAGFPQKMEVELEQQANSLTEKLSQKHDYEMKLKTKDLEAEIQLRKEQILSLQSKVEEQQTYISSLGVKSDTASQQVKDIAMKAIENSRQSWPEYRPWERKKEKDDDRE